MTTKHHSTHPLTHLQAHTFLQTYLHQAHSNPSLRPDAVLSSAGVIAQSGNAASNLALSHLSRVLLGIEGRRITGSVLGKQRDGVQDETGGDHSEGSTTKRRRVSVEHEEAQANEDETVGADADWQDKESFEHAQEEITLEEQAGTQPGFSTASASVAAADPSQTVLGRRERDARKEDKKARKKAEKQARNEARKSGV